MTPCSSTLPITTDVAAAALAATTVARHPRHRRPRRYGLCYARWHRFLQHWTGSCGPAAWSGVLKKRALGRAWPLDSVDF